MIEGWHGPMSVVPITLYSAAMLGLLALGGWGVFAVGVLLSIACVLALVMMSGGEPA